MADDDISGGGAILVAFALGAIAGAATALLLAPTTGEETRRLLTDKARESREKASDAARQGRDFIDRQKDTFSSAIERGKEAYQRARGTESEA